MEIDQAAREEAGVKKMATAVMLGSSPIFVKVEHGLYALVGRRLATGALGAARVRSKAEPPTFAP